MNKKISAFSSNPGPLDGTEELPLVQAGDTYKTTSLEVADTLLLQPIDFNQANAISTGWGNVEFRIQSPLSEAGISLKNNGTGGLQWNIISTSTASGIGGGIFSIGDATNSREYIRINGNGGQLWINNPVATAANFAVAAGGAEFQMDDAGGYFVLNIDGTINTEVVHVNVAEKYINLDEHAQGYSVKIGTQSVSDCAVLKVESTTQGILLPRMTKVQRGLIISPEPGLAIYQTDNTPGLRVFNGINWVRYTETTD